MNFRVLLLLVVSSFGCGRVALPLEVEGLRPVEVADVLVEVDVGPFGHCTRSREGRVECFQDSGAAPGPFVLVERGARAISVGGSSVYGQGSIGCALLADGAVRCLHTEFSVEPEFGEGRADGAIALSLGYQNSCALFGSGEVRCSADRMFRSSEPVEALQGAVSLSCGYSRCCSVMANGAARCVVLGRDVMVEDVPGSFVEVTAGMWHACARDAAGAVQCWGDSAEQLVPSGSPSFISAGIASTCAIDAAGDVVCTRATCVGALTQTVIVGPAAQMDASLGGVCAIVDGTVECAQP